MTEVLSVKFSVGIFRIDCGFLLLFAIHSVDVLLFVVNINYFLERSSMFLTRYLYFQREALQ